MSSICSILYNSIKDLVYCLLFASGLKTDKSFAAAQVFYKDLGDIAMENGYVSIKLKSGSF